MTARFGSSDAVGVVAPPSARRSVSASLSGLACVATVSHRLSQRAQCRTAGLLRQTRHVSAAQRFRNVSGPTDLNESQSWRLRDISNQR